MGKVYQGCPFCDHVFEIGATDYRPMKRHIRTEHTESGGSGKKQPSSGAPIAASIPF
jgi:hypothetical protein